METFTTKHRPIKGILKKSSPGSPILSTMGTGAGAVRGEEFSKKSQKWEELDILATYHHKDKNYEPMNIEEYTLQKIFQSSAPTAPTRFLEIIWSQPPQQKPQQIEALGESKSSNSPHAEGEWGKNLRQPRN
uniref:Uncharacterized protein n=1 Tax=Monodelphis domestica TaxID=13616 RepID=A0A5F8G8N1_MONDO